MKVVGNTYKFDTHKADKTLKQYDGMKCVVLRQLAEYEYDYADIGDIWRVKLENGMQIDALDEEVVELDK